MATPLVDNALAHWLLDAAKISAALGTIGTIAWGISKTRFGRWVAGKWRAAFTEPRDQRFAATVHAVVKPELDALRAEKTAANDALREELREQLTAVKEETRGVIEAHTVEEMAGVTRQIEVAERIEGIASEALDLGRDNARKIQAFADAVGVTLKENP